jgi:glycosyltransferase involved in cell wall biosynthesis
MLDEYRVRRQALGGSDGDSIGPLRPVVVLSAPATRQIPGAGSPRVDYVEIAASLDATLMAPRRRRSSLEAKLLPGGDWRYAWSLRAAPTPAFLTLSEAVGLPLSLVKRRAPRQLLIAHNLTTDRRRAFQRRTRYLQRVDRIIVLCRAQERYLREEAGVPAERVRFLHHNVDHRFFAPGGAVAPEGFVLSVGREQRDYPTLVAAVRRLGVPTVIVPSSQWNPSADTGDLPDNVSVRSGLSFTELRSLYERASVVVVPLRAGVRYAAGASAVLEAMAMARPLVVSITPGISDYVDDAIGRPVPAEDPEALAAAIEDLLTDSGAARQLARRARAVVDDGRNLDAYVQTVTDTAREMMDATVTRG